MKILLVTYNCAPNEGSEDGVGWNMLKTLSREHDVVVVTRGLFKEKVDAECLQKHGHRVSFVYVDNPVSRESFVYQKFYQQLYYLWQLNAARTISRLTRREAFDVVQHITWIRCWMPSAVFGAKSGKVVWGPIGGAESIPKSFLKDWEYGKFSEHLKRWMVAGARFDPLVRLTARKASVGFATTRESQRYMQSLGCKKVHLLGESAMSDDDLQYLSDLKPAEGSPIRFISMGRLLGWKGFQYGIQAFANANIPKSEYWVVGDGPMRSNLEELAKKLGVENQIHFFGRVDRGKALELLSQCHVLLHPSLRDSGGWVCLEAMAARRPVICLNLGGPAVQVTPETGTIVEAESPQQVIRDIAAAMTRYAEDREFLCGQGERGLIRVLDFFTWEKKIDILSQWYAELLEE
jgi:glycosyltransferase involved in cell wall biosynthesis